MNSRLLRGSVSHRRSWPLHNTFRYGVFYSLFDLDELGLLDERLRLFSYDRANLVSLFERDHFAGAAPGLRLAVLDRLASRGFPPGAGRTMLLTNARVFGYTFNPVSFFLHLDSRGKLLAVIAEVHNMQGDEHLYDLDLTTDGAGHLRATADKRLYVSPFIEMDARYEFSFDIDPRAGRYDIGIDEYRGDRRFFRVRLSLEALPFTDGTLGRLLLRYPWVTLQTIGLIHWQALKLWRRGLRYRKNPRRMEVRR